MYFSSQDDPEESSPHGHDRAEPLRARGTEWSSPTRQSADWKRLPGLSMSEERGPLPCCRTPVLVKGNQRPERSTPRGRGRHSRKWLVMPSLPRQAHRTAQTSRASAPAVGLRKEGHSKNTCVPSMLGTQTGEKECRKRQGTLHQTQTTLSWSAQPLFWERDSYPADS